STGIMTVENTGIKTVESTGLRPVENTGIKTVEGTILRTVESTGFAAVENRNFAKRRHTLYESHDNGKHWWPVLGGMKSVNRLFAFGPGQLWAVGTVPGYVPNDLVAILKPE
ncbi:MAG: hypothetical protein QF437_30200, partial [Planctomycetota bacterium]|nr:hypothetical protein [Planctomycetota bacterium]